MSSFHVRAVVTLLAAAAPSAAQFAELGPAGRMPTLRAGLPLAFVPVDIDGDGALDLVSAGYSESGGAFLLRNDGGGAFADVSATNLPSGAAQARRVAAGDVDRDGDVDLVLSRDGDPLLLNDGRGRFTNTASGVSLVSAYDCALADFDRDGDLDLQVADGSPPRNALFVNDGTGGFTERSGQTPVAPSQNTLSFVPADIDRDGDIDVVVMGWYALMVWVNDGTGRIREESNRLPAPAPAGMVRLGDVDADGDLDLLASPRARSACCSTTALGRSRRTRRGSSRRTPSPIATAACSMSTAMGSSTSW